MTHGRSSMVAVLGALVLLALMGCPTQRDLEAERVCKEVGFAIAARTFACTGDDGLANGRYDDFMARYRCDEAKLEANKPLWSTYLGCADKLNELSCETVKSLGDDFGAWLVAGGSCANEFMIGPGPADGGVGGSAGSGGAGGASDAGFDAGPCTPSLGPLAWWPAEGDAQDLAQQHHGTVSGPVAYLPAKVGRGFVFDTTGFLTTSDTGLPGGQQARGLMAWISTTYPGDAFFFGYGFPGSGTTWAVGVSGGKLAVSVGGETALSDQIVADGAFHHVAVVVQAGGAHQLFVDGVGSAPKTLATMATPLPGEAFIGKAPSLPPFAGMVDELEIYGILLDQAQITAHAAAPGGHCRP